MLLTDNKKGLVTLIMKKMKGAGDLTPSFLSEKPEEVKMVDGAEQDNDRGYEACCEDMISAFKESNPKRLKNALKSFITMVIDEYEQSEEEMED
jgi:hypothetical protein